MVMVTVNHMGGNEVVYDVRQKLDGDDTTQKEPYQHVRGSARRVAGIFEVDLGLRQHRVERREKLVMSDK
jgi:galactose-1-phosphate uridylyltransferase